MSQGSGQSQGALPEIAWHSDHLNKYASIANRLGKEIKELREKEGPTAASIRLDQLYEERKDELNGLIAQIQAQNIINEKEAAHYVGDSSSHSAKFDFRKPEEVEKKGANPKN